MPTVSVVIAAYNCANDVEKALQSVLCQSVRDIEVVVVDDGSSDNTISVVEKVARADERVRLLKLQSNFGKSVARNRGLREARGTWIAILDADDWFAPDRLETLISLADEKRVDVVTDNQFFIHERQSQPWRTLYPTSGANSILITAEQFVREDKPGRYGTPGLLKPVIRRSLLVQNAIWYKEEMFTGEDFDFLLRCLQWAPRMWVASKPMYFYQLRSNSTSRTRSLSDWHRIANENDNLANEYSGKDEEEIKKLLLLRGKYMRKSIEFKKIIAAKRNRNWKLFAVNIGKNWQNIGFFSLLALRKMVSHSRNTFIGRAFRQSSHQLIRSAETGRS